MATGRTSQGSGSGHGNLLQSLVYSFKEDVKFLKKRQHILSMSFCDVGELFARRQRVRDSESGRRRNEMTPSA